MVPSVSLLSGHWGVSRQAFYAHEHRVAKREMEVDLILELVRESKRLLPNCGGRKTLYLIEPQLEKMGIACGKDRFFQILGENGLLVRQKHFKPHTTDSRHGFRIYPNLLTGENKKIVQRPFEAIVVDITYIDTLNGFLYLALVTDVFSRKILGYDISDSLELMGCLRAIKMALQLRPKGLPKGFTIHHSDRGSQYCSNLYTEFLIQNHIQISMAETGNCYQNALAERVNGILKMEFEMASVFPSKSLAIQATPKAIHDYNYLRPHLNLNYNNPQTVFENGIQNINKQLFVP